MRWKAGPLKHWLARNDSGVWGDDPTGHDDVEVLRSTDIALNGAWTIENPARRSIPSEQLARKRLDAGDLVVVTSSGSAQHLGKTAIVTPAVALRGATFANFVQRLTPQPGVDSRYIWYLLNSKQAADEMAVLGNTTTGLRNLNGGILGAITCPGPPRAEQRAIADYLDTETSRIDALITKKRRMIELLDEHANAEIMAWVGRSALGTADEIATRPIRRLLRKLERWSTGHGEVVTAFRDGEVTSRVARGREGFTNSWTEGARVQKVGLGDVVVHGLDGFSGAIGDARVAGVCSPIYHVCEPINGDGTFYGRMLRLLALEGYLGGFATSTRERAVDFRNWDLFGRIPIPDVPVAEQRKIGRAIRSIRPLAAKIAASEVLAQERRQALITAAVTGELEIPVAA